MQRNPIDRSYRRVGVGSLQHAAGMLVALMAASLPAWSDTLADLQGRPVAPKPAGEQHIGARCG